MLHRSPSAGLVRYFDQAAPQHHLDEELHVLPVLRRAGHAALAARLQVEDDQMTKAWAGLRERLEPMSRGASAEGTGWIAQVRAFAALYRAHVTVEEGDAYPLVMAGTDLATLATVGAEMAARRGL